MVSIFPPFVRTIAISAFFSLLNERFDPHSAKGLMARVAGATTLGGLLGGVGAERVGALLPAGALLLVLGALGAVSVSGALLIGSGAQPAPAKSGEPEARRGAWTELRSVPLLRELALVTALNRVSSVIRAQLARLVCKGFVSATPWESLAHLPRYLQAMLRRLEKYPENPERDGKHAAAIAELWKLYEARAEKIRRAGERDPRLEEFRWAIEELRVSLFAQELKTPVPVSAKRLAKLWQSIRK